LDIVSIGTLSDGPQVLQARIVWNSGNIPSFCFDLATGPDKYGFDPEVSSSGSDSNVSIGTLSDDPQLLQTRNIWYSGSMSSFCVGFLAFYPC